MGKTENSNGIRNIFKVSEKPCIFRNEKNHLISSSIELEKYELPNSDIYSLDGTLIEKARQESYNTDFLIRLYSLSLYEVKEFLDYHYTYSNEKSKFLDFVKIGTINSCIINDEIILVEAIKKWIIDFDEFKNLLNIDGGINLSLCEYYDQLMKECYDQSRFEIINYKYHNILIPVNNLKLNLLFNGHLNFFLKDYNSSQLIEVNKDILANAYFLGYKKGLKNFNKEYKPSKKQLYDPHFFRTVKSTLEYELSHATLTLFQGFNSLSLKGWNFVKDNIPMVADKNVFHAYGYYQAHYDEALKIIEIANKNFPTDFNSESDNIRDNLWFHVAVKFATGEIYDLLKASEGNHSKVARDMGNISYRPYISTSMGTDKVGGDKNIFKKGKIQIKEVIDYCNENKLSISKEFLDHYNSLD